MQSEGGGSVPYTPPQHVVGMEGAVVQAVVAAVAVTSQASLVFAHILCWSSLAGYGSLYPTVSGMSEEGHPVLAQVVVNNGQLHKGKALPPM